MINPGRMNVSQGQLSSHQIANLSEKLPRASKAVVWVGDKKFLPLIEVSMSTFVKTLEMDAFAENVTLCLIHDGVSRESLETLEQGLQLPDNLKFSGLEIPRNFPEVHPASTYPSISYARLLIPSVFANYETVLYLDADTWILQDLSPLLLNQLPDGNTIGAALDPSIAIQVEQRAPTPPQTEMGTADVYLGGKLGLESSDDYFNAGVLVFHPNKMNPASFDDFWVDRVKSYPYWMADQDVLNSYARGRFARLDGSWNYLMGHNWPKSPAKKDIKILHFTGLARPWLIYLGTFCKPYHQLVISASVRGGIDDFYSGNPPAMVLRTILLFGFRSLPGSLSRLVRPVLAPINRRLMASRNRFLS
jgi:lipopolysaccharide biosynthesis glycosyltransferase